ncbi:hypothetical protein L2E82_40678 [Cichorium intybus]|uniref:Uncharacterized protein n=1 Tax=Cichorium intybus TaxID=13427 RepID=A0ACB9AND0_CICIN|nr:hypothetical protein L2E82_40678 [Cichorium intybus]
MNSSNVEVEPAYSPTGIPTILKSNLDRSIVEEDNDGDTNQSANKDGFIIDEDDGRWIHRQSRVNIQENGNWDMA